MTMIETSTNLRHAPFHRRSPEQGYSLLDRIAESDEPAPISRLHASASS